MAKVSPAKQTMDGILKTYLANIQRGGREGTSELEVRFGTAKGMKPLTRIEYENVIKRFVSAGFDVSKPQYLLRIGSEYTDPKTGVTKISNIRAELSDIGIISEYCKSNSLDDLYTKGQVKFIQKGPQKIRVDGEVITVEHYDASDFNFRTALSLESDYTHSVTARSMVSSWKDNKKEFRYINRHTLTHKDFPLKVDVSIVKQSSKKGYNVERNYTFGEANLSKSSERYEIELEVDNDKVGIGTPYNKHDLLSVPFRKAIMMVLSGLQGTNYPISYPQQNDLLQEYMRILWDSKYKPQRVYPKNFVGPSSVALQINNISVVNEYSNTPNIRNGYTVTEKADGDRKLLMVSKDGNIYLIDTNMSVQFTGAKTAREELFGSIVDGEHITHNKKGEFINLYAAFDIYYLKGKDLRRAGFVGKPGENPDNFRLPLLNSFMDSLRPFGIKSRDSSSPMRFEVKTFYSSSDKESIFSACLHIMNRVNVNGGVFEYNTDGLIFTPMFAGVGGSKIGETTKLPIKTTWNLSFKWKPPEHNTIDFMVTIQRGTDGREDIKNVFQSGTDLGSAVQITQYKTAILRVGFNETKHGYTNPCLNVIEDNLPDAGDKDNEDDYKPMRFYPSNPADDEAGVCNLLLEPSFGGTTEVFTENREVIEDNMIVEFRYNTTKDPLWRWEPLRVRYDKTTELRSGGKNYGNAYHVADSNWQSIHKPITQTMITTGNDIPIEAGDDDVYYNRGSGKRQSTALRDFHNLYVKKKLIQSVSKRNDTLIDFAVGMGGDFSKWIDAKLKFVFGIDIMRDNIENRLNGACARYLNNKKRYTMMPSALFVIGNSSVNIRDTTAILTDKGKQITNAVFGKGAKDVVDLGKGVYKHYGIGATGFDVASIQFALHYMFENSTTLNNFLRNVSETTKVGGYFIGTCYDGTRVFNKLIGKAQGEGIESHEDTVKLWSIIKRYPAGSFNPESSSLGYGIDVFMDSIGKVVREYLVNFDYLERLLSNYGFALLTHEEARSFGLRSGRGSFRDLYGAMEEDNKRYPVYKTDYGTAGDMTDNEKTLSFLNNYFIYKKIHNVDADAIAASIMTQSLGEESFEEMPQTKTDKKSMKSAAEPASEAKTTTEAPTKPAAEPASEAKTSTEARAKTVAEPVAEKQSNAPKKLKKKLKLVE